VLTTLTSHGQSQQSITFDQSGSTSLWFVELSSPPGIDGTPAATLEQEEAAFHAAARGAGIAYSKSLHFRELFNGLTVRAAASDVNKLRALPGVQAVYPVMKITRTEVDGPPVVEPDLITAIQQTGADIAQNELGLTGRGVNVAIIDTGLDYDHPDLGGCFGPGC